MIVGGENLAVLVLDKVSYAMWKEMEPLAVEIQADNSSVYLIVKGYPFIIRQQRG